MLKIENLAKSFNRGTEYEIKIFEDLNLGVNKGECVAILGGNGCGKSTLFNLISGTLTPDAGKMWINNTHISTLKEEERAKHVARVCQNPSDGVSPSLTILENMALASKKCQRFSLKSLYKKQDIEGFRNRLKEVGLGLEDKLHLQAKYLSGGQRQALSLIMVTINTPDILLLDEHTAALDPKTSHIIMEKTRQLITEQGLTTLMISHNLQDAIQYGDRLVMLNKGEVILDVSTKDITIDEVRSTYTMSA
ncbi:MAG: ABC transporter ATP-binding protein [Epulopiscium sp. Nele67-Bin005]|nr:MAG: ABC transporter ATP-binding protein [Epulopiscium sp. Nele67-Bin005]